MSVYSQSVPIAPQPCQVARRLADESDLFFLWSAHGQGPSYVAIRPVEVCHGLDPEPSLRTFDNVDPLSATPRWIGLLPYEAQRHLERARYRIQPDRRSAPHLSQVTWWRFEAVVRIAETVQVVGDNLRAVRQLRQKLLRGATEPDFAEVRVRPGESLDSHRERIVEAQKRIAAGDIYQVNLARRIEAQVSGELLDLLELLARNTRPAFALALRSAGLEVVSTSPELFLRQWSDRKVETIPIKGTRPRSDNPHEDARLAAELESDPKERAELSMIVDVERNDLGKIAQLCSVEVPDPPRVFSQGLVWHRLARVTARCAAGVERQQLLQAMLPSGSVTGAPKIRAMEIIAELEPHRRGLYTGAMGCIDRAGRLNLSMAIRTLTVRHGEGHYFSGGGIVADSDPDREVTETAWKARQLGRLM